LIKTRWFYGLAGLAVVAAIPSAIAAYRHHRDALARAHLSDFLHDPQAGDEGWTEIVPHEEEDEGFPEDPRSDDPLRRMIMERTLWGPQTPEATQHLAKVAYAESRKWASPLHQRNARTSAPQGFAAPNSGPVMNTLGPASTAPSWANLGPTNAAFEWNGGNEPGAVDSGRPNSIAVNPTNPQIVYLATSGGGVWKSYDFTSGSATWVPITETIGNLAIGAMDLDPNNPDTLYVGTGDFVDTPGGQVVKTVDGGGSWGNPVALSGTYPASAGSLAVSALRIRAIKVDPSNSNIVLVATEVGLFRSTNAGASFSLVDLPNAGTQLAESLWTIVYTGQVGGVSHWAVSGVYACAQGVLPPDADFGVASGAAGCAAGNPGDIWTSSDSGATWSSRKTAGGLPALAVGRITMGAGSTATPATTVIYAQLGSEDEGASTAVGYWRSNDAGSTWTQINGTLNNPTTSTDCADVNVGNQQAWYNSAVTVDPANSAHVMIGGMLCGLRTLNGLNASPTWENISHWLPAGGGGSTSAGTLPYVHADWHAALVVSLASAPHGYLAFAGTDGGLFSSTDVFDSAPTSITWAIDNKGLVTHLSYSVASGDPVDGNAYVAFTGLQDNGTRFRDTNTANSTVFNQVIGGDGFGTAVGNPGGGTPIYWASVEYSHETCTPSAANSSCNKGGAWSAKDPSLKATCSFNGTRDAEPFNVRYAVARPNANANTFISGSNYMMWKVVGTGLWKSISPCFPGFVREVVASQVIDGLYGAAMSGGHFQVTSNCGGTATACTWTQSSVIGVDLNGNGTVDPSESMSYTAAIGFPTTTPAGKTAGDVYLASTTAPITHDNLTYPSNALGHLFITQDRGATFAPFHGNGTGFDLPNVGVNAILYDPGDATNNTIWVGTQVGVYRSTDGGNTWARYGEGLPMASVTGLFIGRNGGLLRASTYGRGLWEIYPNATSEHGVNGDGDFDRNLQIDGFDLGAMASRLGTDPSTTVQPFYDWNLDMTGSVNAIDDSGDLTTFLTKFGNHP
jgi:hypothetical protein